MSESKVLLQFCIEQNRLVERLDHFQHSLEKLYRRLKDRHGLRLERRAQRLAHELDQFTALFQKSALGAAQLQPHFEKFLLQARQLKVSLALQWRERNGEEWKGVLAALSAKVQSFRTELKSLDLGAVLGHVADAVIIDRFDNLAHIREIQWPRKLWHVLASLIIVSIYLFMSIPFQTKMIVFGIFTFYATVCDIVRLCWPKFNTLVVRDLQKFMRKREISGLNSMTFYALSAFFVCLLFPKGVAVLAILYLGLGDPMASIVGIKWGRHKLGPRFSLEGSLAFFATCFFLTLLYPVLDPTFSGNPWVMALAGGFIGMASEWCSGKLDDNLVVPLVSATLLQITLSFLG